jgi:uncharacterized protein (DUF302 family)
MRVVTSTSTLIRVRRFTVVSSKPFAEVVESLTSPIGQPDLQAFEETLRFADCLEDLVDVAHAVVGPSGLMEFGRFDVGELLRKVRGYGGARLLRILVGNPLVMKDLAKAVPDAAAYAPVSILVDERPDGVHISYDSLASLLASYGSERAITLAEELDKTVEILMTTAAR